MTGPAHRAEFRLPATEPGSARRLAKVISVEARSTPKGTTIEVLPEPDAVRIRVAASDARGLRAASSSILRVASVAWSVDAASEPLKSARRSARS